MSAVFEPIGHRGGGPMSDPPELPPRPSAAVFGLSSCVPGSEHGVESGVSKRAWVFTWNNYPSSADDSLRLVFDSGLCRYLIYGKEVGSQNGTPHLQGFIYFSHDKSRKGVSKILPGCFVAFSKDNPKLGFPNAIGYCRKEGRFVEYGTAPVCQKRKGELSLELFDSCLLKAKNGQLDEIPSNMLVRYYTTWQKIKKDFMVFVPDAPSVCGIWVQGPAGCGKSRLCRNLVGNIFYPKMRNHWWDGYQGEKYVIMDDIDKFNVSLGGLLKDWTDRYPFMAEMKGSAIRIRPSLFFVTSQYSVSDIFEDQATCDALRRRCLIFNFFDTSFEPPVNIENILSQLLSRNS